MSAAPEPPRASPATARGSEHRAAAILGDVAVERWRALLRAVRRVMDRTDRAELPPQLRPFAGWKPDALARDRPRTAVIAALVSDPRLREAVGEELDAALWAAAADTDVTRLLRDHGADEAVAVLAARGRWEDLAVVAAEDAKSRAAQERASADQASLREAAADAVGRRRLLRELDESRTERDVLRRRLDSADQQRRRVERERDRLAERIADLEADLQQTRAQLAEERRSARRQAERLRRRLVDAQARARVDAAQIRAVAVELDRLAGGLREALTPAPLADVDETAGVVRPEAVSVPREVPPATRGRPCKLPPGVRDDTPLAVEALLKSDGLEVVLDGYNITKHVAGRPLAPLEEQRDWLLRLAAGVAARFGRRVTVVFDGTEPRPGATSAPRGVLIAFSEGEETADERIVAIVAGGDPGVPVLVVSADRQVRADVGELGANVASPPAFLQVAGA